MPIEYIAGPALDKLIAEQVMGWTCPAGYNYWMTFSQSGFSLHEHKASWSPSTNIEHALQVLDKIGLAKEQLSDLSPLTICIAALKETKR